MSPDTLRIRGNVSKGEVMLLTLPFHLIVAYIGGGLVGVICLARVVLGWAAC